MHPPRTIIALKLDTLVFILGTSTDPLNLLVGRKRIVTAIASSPPVLAFYGLDYAILVDFGSGSVMFPFHYESGFPGNLG